MPEKAEPDELRDMAEVDIDIVHCPGIDALARNWVGLVGKAQIDTVDPGQCAIQFGRGRGPSPHANPERFSARVGILDPMRERERNGLWISRPGKAAHADI